MNKKKYVIYKIKIVYGDGTVEYRNDSGYSVSSFQEMKSLFAKVEKEVCDKDCRIALLGVNFNGKNSLIKERDFTKLSEEEKRIYETSFTEYAMQIQDILKKIKMKKDYHTQMLAATNKKSSIIDHRIETFGRKQWCSEEDKIQEKLRIFDESECIRKEERYHKDELEIVLSIKDRVDLKQLNEAFNVQPKDNSRFKYLDDEMVESLGMMKEVYFSSEKDRVRKVRVFKQKYDKVKVDCKNKKIIGYNKSFVKI